MTPTTRLNIAELAGTDLSARTRARALRGDVVKLAPVTLNFAGVECVSDSFLDELFGVLVAERGLEWFRANIVLEGLSTAIRHDLLAAVRARLEQQKAARPSLPATECHA